MFIIILLLSLLLSTITVIIINFQDAWKIPVCIISFAIGFLLCFAILLYIISSIVTIKVTKKTKETKYKPLYRKFLNFYTRLFLSILNVKINVIGSEKLPKNNNFILLQNHISNIDPIVTNYVLEKTPLIFVTKKDSFRTPIIGKLMMGLGYIKLERKSGVEDASEIMRAVKWINDGESSLAIYPEGTRNKTFPNPILLSFKEQIFGIIKKTKKPIVISVIRRSDLIKKRPLFKKHKIEVNFIKIIEPEEYSNLTPAQLSELVRRYMSKILI